MIYKKDGTTARGGILTSCVRMRPSFIRDWMLNIDVRSSTNVILNAGFWRMPIFGAVFKKISSQKHENVSTDRLID